MELETTPDVDLVAVETADGVDVLLDIAAPRCDLLGVSLLIRPADEVPAFMVWNELPVSGAGDGVMVALGDIPAGEQRRILLSFEVPGMSALGAMCICELTVGLISTTEPPATIPVNVNAVSLVTLPR